MQNASELHLPANYFPTWEQFRKKYGEDMSFENLLESLAWILGTISIFTIIPLKKAHEAQVSFLFAQVPTWLFGVLVVQFDWIEYPVRFFSKAVNTSFTYEFFVLPVISAIYTTHYPENKTKLKKLLYSVSFPFFLTLAEVLAEKTKLINYIHWSWYYSFLSIWGVLILTHRYTKWFFNSLRKRRS